MAQATQLTEILGGSSPLMQKKKGGKAGLEDALFSGGNPMAGFQSLFASFSKKSAAVTAATVDTSALTANNAAAIIASASADGTPIPAELLKQIQSLTPEQLASLQIDPSTIALDGTNTAPVFDEKVLGILDALANLGVTGEKAATLFKLVSDPKLAAALAGIAAKLQAAQTDTAQPTTTTDPTAASVASQLAANNGDISVKLSTGETLTINVADLDADGFNALKKLAYADLAPFLTQPRIVRIDSNTVMKVTQGPSFLNDEGTDTTMMSIIAGLMGVMPQAQIVQANTTIDPLTGLADATTATDAKGTSLAALLTAAAAQGTVPTAAATATDAAVTPSALAALTVAANPQKAVAPTVPSDHNTATKTETPLFTAPTIPVGMDAIKTTTPITPATLALTAAAAAMTPKHAATSGIVATAKGLDNALGGQSFGSFDDAMHGIAADPSQSFATSANNLLSAKSAGQTHPASYLVSASLQKAASDVPSGIASERQFVIQLDPPNLGRVKITLDFAENNTVKAKILAERPETVSLLQKDSSLLERTLQNSGFDASASGAISFNLAQGDSFSQSMRDSSNQSGQNKKSSSSEDGTDFAIIENALPIFVDPKTGLTHVNVVI